MTQMACDQNKLSMLCSIDSIRGFRERVNKGLDELEERVKQRFEENNRSISEISEETKMPVADVAPSDSLAKVNEKTSQIIRAFLEREEREKMGKESLEAFG